MAGSYSANGFSQQPDAVGTKVASTVTQIDGEEIRGARHLGAAVAGHGASSLSVVLAACRYRWISKALSTLRHLTWPHRRRIDVTERRVENGEAFSTRHSRLFRCQEARLYDLSVVCVVILPALFCAFNSVSNFSIRALAWFLPEGLSNSFGEYFAALSFSVLLSVMYPSKSGLLFLKAKLASNMFFDSNSRFALSFSSSETELIFWLEKFSGFASASLAFDRESLSLFMLRCRVLQEVVLKISHPAMKPIVTENFVVYVSLSLVFSFIVVFVLARATSTELFCVELISLIFFAVSLPIS